MMQENVRVVVAELCDGERYLITQRSEGSLFGGMWEFPGGKQEPCETIEACIKRELKEELDIAVTVGEQLIRSCIGMWS